MHEQHDRRYFKWGLTALTVIFISILLVVIFTNLPGFFSLLGAVGKILSPLVSGIVIAFLLNPIVNFVDLRLRPLLEKPRRRIKSAAVFRSFSRSSLLRSSSMRFSRCWCRSSMRV